MISQENGSDQTVVEIHRHRRRHDQETNRKELHDRRHHGIHGCSDKRKDIVEIKSRR